MPTRLLLLLSAGACLWAQTTGREQYRQAYQDWRQADPTLEVDAATAGQALAPRTQSAARAAAAFISARAEFLDIAAEQSQAQQSRLAGAAPPPAPPLAGSAVQDVAQAATQNVAAILNSLAGDQDAAIAQLRQTLERERATLAALNAAMQRRQQAVTATQRAGDGAEKARQAAVEAYAAAYQRRTQAAQQVRKEGMAWQTYHQLLAEGARGSAISSAAPAPAGAPVLPPAPKLLAPKPSITPVPLARYVGGWTFPSNGIYKGAQPEFVDVVVHEENGHVTGTLYGRFVLPAGSTGDPVLRFDFDGDLQPERNQVFDLRTTEGATGTVELIPGPAFNLLEVNFQTTPVENKVRTGNFVLLKK